MIRIKRAIVASELIVGAFILATISGVIAQQVAENAVVSEAVRDPFIKTLIALFFIGGVLFYDGLRRGRLWW